MEASSSPFFFSLPAKIPKFPFHLPVIKGGLQPLWHCEAADTRYKLRYILSGVVARGGGSVTRQTIALIKALGCAAAAAAALLMFLRDKLPRLESQSGPVYL